MEQANGAQYSRILSSAQFCINAQMWISRCLTPPPSSCSITRVIESQDVEIRQASHDKWRNINVTAIWGSRQKAKLALKKNSLALKHHDNPMALSTMLQNEEIVDAKPLAISNGTTRTNAPKEPLARLDRLISEAINNLKEPRGSDRAAIALYIEEHYWAPPNLKKLLSTKLKHMTANGKLIKVKHKYRIAPNSALSGRRNVPLLLLENKHLDSSKAEKSEVKIITKSQVDSELSKMKVMTAEEAAIAAARAVAEAEAAIAEAERAAREAEEAEAEAESAQVFAEAAMKALECRTFPSRSPVQKVLLQGNVF
ncbi:telomere repeat-binding factor 2-like isoform X2 [Cucurbita pepo subsp. pepo]|uniref:telomere repeat-binding factor 2-like isoform X2 n=1 Tax=Cucurbita pepo subsp. pepo TaxID=3664 RepID=UPI000C9D54FB|nr:telomere repeat-binding factor 2-like isoform X2 [Cucurbita pepo subsp. pepo]